MTKLLGIVALIAAGCLAWFFVISPTLNPRRGQPHALPQSRPDALVAARAFYADWDRRQYTRMYTLLSQPSRQAITGPAFVARYGSIGTEATIDGVNATLAVTRITTPTALLQNSVTISTTALGPMTYTTPMTLTWEGHAWHINWSPDLIFPGLGETYRIHMFTTQPRRGAILARTGAPLAAEGYMLPVGVVPQYIQHEKSLIAFLSSWLHMPVKQIHAMIHVPWAQKNPQDFVPIGTVSSVQWNAVPANVQEAEQQNGLEVKTQVGQRVLQRLYPLGSLASPLLGYVSATDSDGQAGLELWANSYLTGITGTKLTIATPPDFAYITRVLKERPVQDGDTLHLTLDPTLQQAAEQALAGKVGAVVALRPGNGEILALASTPGFDPAVFAKGISAQAYHALVSNPSSPLLNRATLGQYPPGSLFKLVTMGAALEKAGYTSNTTKDCPGVWYGLGPSYPKHDWLPQGHGILTLHEALVQSCDTYFYAVGQELDRKNHMLLPTYARAWGLGQPTGIVGVPEAAGVIPDAHYTATRLHRPWVPGNAVDMAIGQGDVLVTPLQIAQLLGALGDQGVMHRPYVVQSITDPNGKIISQAKPVVTRHLPLSAAHLNDILSAMGGVTSESTGTAQPEFAGFSWSVDGKTGTAQTGDGRNPDAWFAALAPSDQPTIALVVLVEHAAHGGEGATVAAPLARQILQTFMTKDQALAGTSGPKVLNVP